MDGQNREYRGRTEYKAMPTSALEEILRRDLKENLLDVETICIVSRILRDRLEMERPEEIPPIDLAWKSFRENYISLKARVRRFLRRMVPLFLVILSVLAAALFVYWYGTRPTVTESLLDSISMEDGSFSYRGLRADMSDTEVKAWLDERDLLCTEGAPVGSVHYQAGWYQVEDITWIIQSGEMRIRELEKLPFRCTFYFKRGRLTHVDLESDLVRGDLTEVLQKYRMAVYALETKFGTASGNFAQTGPDGLGEKTAFWLGEGTSRLELSGRHERFLKQDDLRIVRVDEESGELIDGGGKRYDPAENPYRDQFFVMIRVVLTR